jgi:hypothetical protein
VLGLGVVGALLLLPACKKSKTAADVSVSGEVRLLDKGDRRRSELRYAIADGTTTSSTTTLRLTSAASSGDGTERTALPGLRLDMVSGPAELTERGVKFVVEVVKSEVLVPRGLDEGLAEELRDLAAVAKGVGGWIEIDDRGRRLDGAFNEQAKRSDVPLRLIRAIVNARTTLTRVQLPAQKVGLGAKWEFRRTVTAYGINIDHVTTYTLVDRVGDEIMLDVSVQQSAAPQTIEFPKKKIWIAVHSIASKATGQIVLDLSALVSDASAAGASEDHLIVKTAEDTQAIDISEEFEVQIANTTSLSQ